VPAELDLKPGRAAIALIKSSFVILARGDASLRTSAAISSPAKSCGARTAR